ncbi:MAG: FGGY family carbohydrate kinase [Candidatus Brocadiia bacterium]
MADTLLIGIDAGTQSVTACAWTPEGRLAGIASSPLTVERPRPGWAEQNPEQWTGALFEALRETVTAIESEHVAAIGLAFQRETFVLLDDAGRPVRPAILWLDVRAQEQARQLGAEFGDKAYHELTGKPLDATSAAARMLWLREHDPDRLARASRWEDVGAALAHALTGRHATCPAGADTCGLVALEDADWCEALLEAAGLRTAQMPELVTPGQAIGPLTAEAAARTGLPAGTPVVAAGGDGHVFGLGMGAVQPGRTSLTLGTSIVLGVHSEQPVLRPAFRTLIGCAGGYLLECVLQAGTYLLRWFVRCHGGDEARWNRRAAAIAPGCDGLVTLPHWWGMRFPEHRPDARGVTLGWSDHHCPAHLYRSLLEGVAFELRRALDEMAPALPHRPVPPLRVGGGGARSELWTAILADVLEMPVRRQQHAHATALGAAALAGVGAGLFGSPAEAVGAMTRWQAPQTPEEGRAELYRRLYADAYVPATRALSPLWPKLRAYC